MNGQSVKELKARTDQVKSVIDSNTRGVGVNPWQYWVDNDMINADEIQNVKGVRV